MTQKVSKKPSKKQKALAPRKNSMPSEATLFKHVSSIIEKRRYRAGAYANREITLIIGRSGTISALFYLMVIEANTANELCRSWRHAW
jgi:hypothetical protein